MSDCAYICVYCVYVYIHYVAVLCVQAFPQLCTWWVGGMEVLCVSLCVCVSCVLCVALGLRLCALCVCACVLWPSLRVCECVLSVFSTCAPGFLSTYFSSEGFPLAGWMWCLYFLCVCVSLGVSTCVALFYGHPHVAGASVPLHVLPRPPVGV